MAEPVGDRLARMLGLLPYLAQADRPLPIGQVAEHFGVSEMQIRKDLRALWLVGTPGMGYEDMLQFGNYEYDDDYVDLRDARGLTRPLRLNYPEAIALTAALRALQPMIEQRPELSPVVASTLEKLRASSGSTGPAAPPIETPDRLTNVLDVRLPRPGDPDVAQTVTAALVGGRQLQIEYVDGSDNWSRRRVDPVRLYLEGGGAYLVAWCWQADGPRTFRMDRILQATLLEEGVEHWEAGESALPITSPDEATEGPSVTLRLAPSARWLVEELPTEESFELPDGSFAVTIRVRRPDWLRRLLLAQGRNILELPTEIAADVASAARSALTNYPTD